MALGSFELLKVLRFFGKCKISAAWLNGCSCPGLFTLLQHVCSVEVLQAVAREVKADATVRVAESFTC